MENINKFSEFISENMNRKPLRIVRKNWDIKVPGYKIEFNNLQDHPLIPRIQDRTDLTLNDIKTKFEKAVNYIVKKNDKGFFKQKTMVEFLMKKSDFKVLIMINPADKYIRISTVLASDMKTSNTVKWNLNEEELQIHKIEVVFEED
jgi:hypothetical protein